MHAVSAITKATVMPQSPLSSSSLPELIVSLLLCISDDVIIRVRPLARLSVIIISDMLPTCYASSSSSTVSKCLRGLLVALYHHEKPMLQLQREEGGFIPFAVKQDHIAAVSILKVADIISLQSSSPSSPSPSVWDIIARFDAAISMLYSISTPTYDNISTFITTVINSSGSSNSSGDFLSALLAITFQKLVTKPNQQGTITTIINTIITIHNYHYHYCYYIYY